MKTAKRLAGATRRPFRLSRTPRRSIYLKS
jgi:hypothetical protein